MAFNETDVKVTVLKRRSEETLDGRRDIPDEEESHSIHIVIILG